MPKVIVFFVKVKSKNLLKPTLKIPKTYQSQKAPPNVKLQPTVQQCKKKEICVKTVRKSQEQWQLEKSLLCNKLSAHYVTQMCSMVLLGCCPCFLQQIKIIMRSVNKQHNAKNGVEYRFRNL